MAKTFTAKEWSDAEREIRKSPIYGRDAWLIVEMLRMLKNEIEWLEKRRKANEMSLEA